MCRNAVSACSTPCRTTASFLGKGGGSLAGVCDLQILVPGETSDRIQELHMLILHTLVECVEGSLFPR